jgi:hypothetical protein
MFDFFARRWFISQLWNPSGKWGPLRSVMLQYCMFRAMLPVLLVMMEMIIVTQMLLSGSPWRDVLFMVCMAPVPFLIVYCFSVIYFAWRFNTILTRLYHSRGSVQELDLSQYVRRHVLRTRFLHEPLFRLRGLSLSRVLAAVLPE